MDVARLLEERASDVATFSAALFRTTALATSGAHDVSTDRATRAATTSAAPSSSSPLSATASPLPWRAPCYRRPASDNVPVSRVLRSARERAKRARSRGHARADTTDAREAAKLHTDRGSVAALPPPSLAPSRPDPNADAAREKAITLRQAQLTRLRIKQYHRHVLPVKRWNLLLKRRRRLWLRRRTSAVRRHRQRRTMLRTGKPVPACRCAVSARRAAARRSRPARSACTWLPSHSRLVSRFHMRVRRVVLPADGTVHADRVATPSRVVAQGLLTAATRGGTSLPSLTRPSASATEFVRVAVADVSRRKHHRLLQRWCATVSRAPAHQARPLPAYLLADTSDMCVYHVQPRRTPWGTAASDKDDEAALLRSVAAALRLVPSECHATPGQPAVHWTLGAGDEAAPRPSHGAAQALHGHMWAAQGRLVVPATLLAHTVATAAAPVRTLYLVAPRPVRWSCDARRTLHARLVSLWTPCSDVDRLACVFEWWAPTWTGAESSAVLNRLAASALDRATRRPAATGAKARLRVHHDVLVCPAWVSPAAAHTVLLVQRAAPSEPPASPPARTAEAVQQAQRRRLSRLGRRLLFHTARLFLGAVRRVRPVLRDVAPLTARAYQPRVQLVGRDDRQTLRHLLARPSFPHDYRPYDRHLGAASTAAVWQRTLSAHGTPANAGQRVLVGAARADRRLDTAHAQPGCLLVRLRWAALRGTEGSVLRVEHVGVVTTAPFFVHRLGRSVVLVWCVSPLPDGAADQRVDTTTTALEAAGLLALVSAEALEEAESGVQSTAQAVKQRRLERRRRTRGAHSHRGDVSPVPTGVLMPYHHASQTLLDDSACTFAKCFPIYV